MPTLLIHPRCLESDCGTTMCRRVRSDEPCPTCGKSRWQESHEPAFELIEQRSDGWYGVQAYENVHPGDALELLVEDLWLDSRATKLDEGGFYAVLAGAEVKVDVRLAQRDPSCGGLPVHRLAHADENHRWRWPENRHRVEPSWVGPFATREAADTVRYDHAPGYLVCGVCGLDRWKTELPAHYRDHHSGGRT